MYSPISISWTLVISNSPYLELKTWSLEPKIHWSWHSISRTFIISNKFIGPLEVRDIESLLYVDFVETNFYYGITEWPFVLRWRSFGRLIEVQTSKGLPTDNECRMGTGSRQSSPKVFCFFCVFFVLFLIRPWVQGWKDIAHIAQSWCTRLKYF